MISIGYDDLALVALMFFGPILGFAVVALVLLRFAFRRGSGWGLLALAGIAGFLAGPPLFGNWQNGRLEQAVLDQSFIPETLDWTGKTVLVIRPERADCHTLCIPLVEFSGAKAVYAVSGKNIYPRGAETGRFDLQGLIAEQVLRTEQSKNFGYLNTVLQLPEALVRPVDIVVLESYGRLSSEYPLFAPPVPEGWQGRGHFTALRVYEIAPESRFDPRAQPVAQFVGATVRDYPFWTWIYGDARTRLPKGRVFAERMSDLICGEKAKDAEFGFYCYVHP